MVSKEQLPNEESISLYAEILASRFVQRWDQYPKQLEDGSYITVHEPLTMDLVEDHLLGKITLGMYLLDEESRGRCLVLDADNAPDWRRLQALARALQDLGANNYHEKSRRGGHLWAFLDSPQPGRSLRQFGFGLLDYFSIQDVELFPKQDALMTGPGSLVRLPFGQHRKSGRRYDFRKPNGKLLAPTIREQIRILDTPETLSEDFFEQFREVGTKLPSKRLLRPFKVAENTALAAGGGAQFSDRIKTVPIRQLILRYVELSKSGTGLCPFHNDHNPSFAISEQGNFWRCFVPDCVGGGSAIDFYMLYQERVLGKECDFKRAVKELAELLL